MIVKVNLTRERDKSDRTNIIKAGPNHGVSLICAVSGGQNDQITETPTNKSLWW